MWNFSDTHLKTGWLLGMKLCKWGTFEHPKPHKWNLTEDMIIKNIQNKKG